MKKQNIIFLFICWYSLYYSQINTQTRDNAGLRGDAGATSGFFETSNPINFPTGASSWWHLLDIRHTNPNNNYALQLAGSFFDQDLWFRKTNNNAQQPWRKILTTDVAGNVFFNGEIAKTTISGVDGNFDNFLKFGHKLDLESNSTFKNRWHGIDASITAGSSASNKLKFRLYSGSSENNLPVDVLTLQGNGFIGIGTSNPQSQLEIYGGGDITLKGATTDAGDLIFQRNTGVQNGRIWSNDNGGLYFSGLQNIPQLSLVNNGNIGIGTSNPKTRLEVVGDISLSFESNVSPILRRDYGSPNAGGIDFGDGTGWMFNFRRRSNAANLFTLTDTGNASLQGKLEAKEVKVVQVPTADFVFEKDYQLPTLEEVEKYIKEKKHLPEINSAKQMEKEGLNVGEFQIKLLQKIEELTLYIIEQDKKIQKLENKILKNQN